MTLFPYTTLFRSIRILLAFSNAKQLGVWPHIDILHTVWTLLLDDFEILLSALPLSTKVTSASYFRWLGKEQRI
jgi:hypothetical protein